MRNIFLKNSCWECGRKTNPRPFFRKSNLSISLDQEFHSLFLLYAQVKHYQNIGTTSCKAFSKNKKRSGISLLLHFLHGFWRKFFLSLISINYCLIAFTFRYTGNMFIAVVCVPVYDVINFENTLAFLSCCFPI